MPRRFQRQEHHESSFLKNELHILVILSHIVRCFLGISGPEKSRNNTRKKNRIFFTCADIANQLGQVDE